MIYTHVLKVGGGAVVSPLDTLPAAGSGQVREPSPPWPIARAHARTLPAPHPPPLPPRAIICAA